MASLFVRARNVDKLFDWSRSTRYINIRAGKFPPGIVDGANTRLHPVYEIDAIQAAIARGVSTQVRQELVKLLLDLRQIAGAAEEAPTPADLIAAAIAGAKTRTPAQTAAAVFIAIRAADGEWSRAHLGELATA
jgi:hypothetical protein